MRLPVRHPRVECRSGRSRTIETGRDQSVANGSFSIQNQHPAAGIRQTSSRAAAAKPSAQLDYGVRARQDENTDRVLLDVSKQNIGQENSSGAIDYRTRWPRTPDEWDSNLV